MRNRLLSCCLFSLTVSLATPVVRAEIGVIDNVPAATLLLPYFEVDLDNPQGITTRFSVGLAGGFNGASAHLVQVTLWTNVGIPTFAFHIYLTGYDVQTVDVRDIFNGILPVTATDGQDPTDTISKQGPISQDINFASCSDIDPNDNLVLLPYPTPALAPSQIDILRNAHLGHPTLLFGGQCAGFNFGDNIVRGYITIDTVNACTGPLFANLLPNAAGYFVNGGGGYATSQNNLWGDYTLINSSQNFSQGESLVAIEADSVNLNSPGTYTFYGRVVGGTAADNREPLATKWAAPYEVGSSGGGTDLLVWRDPNRPVSPFNCGIVQPSPFPLGHTQLINFDTEENATTLNALPPFQLIPFPLAAMRAPVNVGDLAVPARAGWLHLDLNTTIAGSVMLPPDKSQSHVTVIRSSAGRFSGAHAATPLESALQQP